MWRRHRHQSDQTLGSLNVIGCSTPIPPPLFVFARMFHLHQNHRHHRRHRSMTSTNFQNQHHHISCARFLADPALPPAALPLPPPPPLNPPSPPGAMGDLWDYNLHQNHHRIQQLLSQIKKCNGISTCSCCLRSRCG